MNYTLIGHPCKDIAPDTPQGFLWGGGVLYSGLVAAKMGLNVNIITACEPHDDLYQLHPNIHWHIDPDDKTTTFENRYDPVTTLRHQLLLEHAKTVPVPPVLDPKPNIIHLATVDFEVDIDTLPDFPDVWLVTTPQGWMRRVDENHHVHHIDWEKAFDLLPRLKAVAISQEDVKGDFELAKAYAATGPTVLYTRGADGCIVLHQGEEIHIRAAPTKLVDPTGAGDVIAATFFIRLYETGDPTTAAIEGAIAAAIALEHPGATGIATREEINARLAMWPREKALW